MPGFVVFKGPDTDIDAIERLITKINENVPRHEWPVPAREANIRDILGDTSEKNEQLKTFVNKFACYYADGDMNSAIWQLSENAMFFYRPEKQLEITYHLVSVFPTDAWASALHETFPSLSFFIIGEIYCPQEVCGVEWRTYKDGVCVGSETLIYTLDDWEADDEDELDWDFYAGKFLDCADELAQAELSVWKLDESDTAQLKNAQDAVQAARRKLEMNRFDSDDGDDEFGEEERQ